LKFINSQKRGELRRGLDHRDASIAELTSQLSKEAEVHKENLDGIKEGCRLIRDKCIVPRSVAEDGRYAAEVGRLSAELARQREERKQLQSQIDRLSADSSEELDRKIVALPSPSLHALPTRSETVDLISIGRAV
jgi:phosphoenolpyruvate carboxylase